MRGGLALIFRDPGRVIVLDKSGCLYNLNLREKECSCGEETGHCMHLDFALKPKGPENCLICLRNSADCEALCEGCHTLYHQHCLERRKTYGMSVCLHCGLEWSQAVLKLCYYCGCQVKGVGVICAFCPGLDLCLACYQSNKHGHPAYLMEEEGLVWAPHCVPLLGYFPSLFPKSDQTTTSCAFCEDTAGSLIHLKCGHEVHIDCLIKAIQRREASCKVCLSPLLKGVSRTLHYARRQPMPSLRSFNKSVEYQVSPSVLSRSIGLSITPKAGPFLCEATETLPPLTPLKFKHFHFSGGSEPRHRQRVAVAGPRRASIKRKSKKQSDLSVLTLSFNSQTDVFFKDWNKLPGRFLSKTKGIKRYLGKQEANVESLQV